MDVGFTRENVRHAVAMLRYGRNPAATVYDSIGPDFFLALAPGWLNLGLWEGDGGDPEEAPVAVRRLVERLAAELPAGGDVLDVANGLAAQDPVIAEVSRPTVAHGGEHHVVPAGGGAWAPAGRRRPRRVRGRVPAPVRRRLVRRRDQRGGGVPFLLSRALLPRGVPRPSTRWRAHDVRRADAPSPGGAPRGGRGRGDAARLGSPPRRRRLTRSRSPPRPRPPASRTWSPSSSANA